MTHVSACGEKLAFSYTYGVLLRDIQCFPQPCLRFMQFSTLSLLQPNSMYLQGKVLESMLCSLPRATVLELRETAPGSTNRVPAGILYPSRALELLAAEQIGAIGSSNRIRYLLAKVPVAQFHKSAHPMERSAADLIAQDDRTVIRGHDIQALNYSHNFPINAVYGPFYRFVTRPGHKPTSREIALAVSLGASLR